METCSICLDALDGGVAALACGHRFHAACLASMAGAVGTASSTSRRGTLTACPNCRTTSRVAPVTSVLFSVGDRVLALWGHKWFPGDVYAVKDGGSAYEIAWDDEDSSNTIPASRVRAAPVTVDLDAPATRDARAAAVVTPRVAPSVAPPVAPPAPCANGAVVPLVPRLRSRAPPAPAPRPHVAAMASAWAAVCTDLLEAARRSNMRGLREPLTSRGFICGADQENGTIFTVTVPPDLPCYHDVVGKDYGSFSRGHVRSLVQLRNYLDGVLALARAGGAYRTEAEYKAAAAAARRSRFTGVHRNPRKGGKWRAMISVRRHSVPLGDFDDEEDAARTYDAALVRYKGLQPVNFPGEAPLASVLAALPALSSPPPAQPAPAPPPPGAPRRSPRPRKAKVDPPAPVRRRKRGTDTPQGAKKRKTQSLEERRAKQRQLKQARRQRKKEEKVARRRRIRAYAEKRKRRRELEDDDAADDPGAAASSTSPSLA